MSHFCGWNLSLGCSAILTTNKKNVTDSIRAQHLSPDVLSDGFPLTHLQGQYPTPEMPILPPSPTPPATLFKCCGHRYVKRSVVGVAYPLSGELLLIGRSSADCVSGVKILPSHPPEAFVSPVRAGPSVWRPPILSVKERRRRDTRPDVLA